MSDSDYRPISCVEHERLELAVLGRRWLDLQVDGMALRLLPLDVYTRDGAEWLRAQTPEGETRTLRLDRLGF